MRMFALLLVVVAVSASTGCQSTIAKLRGENFSHEENDLAAQSGALRKPDGESKPFGFSSRAREIERNMGVQ